MKLLVLAQTPPPVHGQSVMVRTMVEGLPPLGIGITHVPLSLSRTHDDIGRWQPRKAFAALRAGFAARQIARAGGSTPFTTFRRPVNGARFGGI